MPGYEKPEGEKPITQEFGREELATLRRLKEFLPPGVFYGLVTRGQLAFTSPKEDRKEFARIQDLAKSLKKHFQPG
jgi:hypothetical protein